MIRTVRKLFGLLLTSVILLGFGLFAYLKVQAWIDPAPIVISTVDGRPVITAEQPALKDFDGELDNSGYDVSFPQCNKDLPSANVGFAIIGLNYGKPFTENPCFAKQWKWAKTHDAAAVYINMADPGQGTATKYGSRIGKDSIKRLKRLDVPKQTPVWLDVETLNTWTTPERSIQVISATMRELTKAGYPVGVYAPPAHWFEVTSNANLDVPSWLAIGKFSTTAKGVKAAKAACKEVSYGNRIPSIVQFVTKRNGRLLDHNLMCSSDPTGLVARQ